jgi:hypothetical protein
MAVRLLMEEFHLSFFVNRGRPPAEVREVRRVLRSTAFRRELRSLLSTLTERIEPLQRLTFKVSW